MPGGGTHTDLSELGEVGKRLSHPSSSKEALCSVLEKASMLFAAVPQSPQQSVLSEMKPSMDALVHSGLLKHKDKDVRVLVATCLSEIMRIVAPDAPYSDEILKEIFELIVASFKGLNEKDGRYFDKRLKILETVATVRSCVVMLDLECDDLIHEMFQIFFSTVSEEPKTLIMAMKAIMCLVIEESEEVPQQLLEVLLANLMLRRKGVSRTAYVLARAVCEKCMSQLTPHVEALLTEGKLQRSKWKETYHDLLFELSRLNPTWIEPLIPTLIDELQADKLDVRLKTVKLVGRILTSARDAFKQLFSEFMHRFSDGEVDVRSAIVEWAKHYLLANPSTLQADRILGACSDRLKDDSAEVRNQVLTTLFDFAQSNLEQASMDLLKRMSECLQDTEVSVRLETFKRLIELYQMFCSKHSKDRTLTLDSFCWIPGKLISCYSEGVSNKEFRPQAMELVFVERLFPLEFAIDDQVKCWVFFVSAFDNGAVEALEEILHQKQRLHREMQNFLDLVSNDKDEEHLDNTRRLDDSCKHMANLFVDPAVADEQLQKLWKLNDPKIFRTLNELLDPNTTVFKCLRLREDMLRSYDGEDLNHGFLRILATKCSFRLFGKEHVHALLAEIMKFRDNGDERMLKASMDLLAIIGRYLPSILEGAQEDVVKLLQDKRDFVRDGALFILAEVGGFIRREVMEECNSVQLLEKLCLEGSRKQAKHAVKVLAATCGDSRLEVFTGLYKGLMDYLHSSVANLPTILQSLGCVAQHETSFFEAHKEDLEGFLIEDLFARESIPSSGRSTEQKDICETTRLKVYGLRMWTRCHLPFKESLHAQPSKGLLDSLSKFLEVGEVSHQTESSDLDKAYLWLAAAAAVLKLSNRYNSQISHQLFLATVLRAKDASTFVKTTFVRKVHKLLMEGAIPMKFACTLVLSTGGGLDGLLEAKEMVGAFVKAARSRALGGEVSRNGGLDSHQPEYVLFYLVHALAQEAGFSGLSNGGPSLEFVELPFRQLYLFIWALLNPDGVCVGANGSQGNEMDIISYILGIFSAIRNSEDAIDTFKTEISFVLCDIGKAIIKDLVGADFSSLKVTDKVPLPPSIYRAVEDIMEGNQKVDKSYLPAVLGERDAMSQLKAALPFSLTWVVKQGKRKRETSPEEDNLLHEDNKVEDYNITPRPLVTTERRKRSRVDQVKPLVIETDINKADLPTLPSSKRKRGIQVGNENGQISSPESASLGETLAKSSRKAKKPNIPADAEGVEHDVKLDGPPATKRVRISIKRPKPTAEPPTSPKEATPKFHGRKKVQVDVIADTQAEPLTSPRGTPRRSAAKHPISSGLEGVDSRAGKDDELGSMRELVGSKIKVWWPMDKKFYSGVVDSYHPSRKRHKVVYDDGDVELLNLNNQRWELLDEKMGSPRSPVAKTPALQSKDKNVDSQPRSSRGSGRARRANKQARHKEGGSSLKYTETDLGDASDEAQTLEQGAKNANGGKTHASVSKHKSIQKGESSGRSGSKVSDAESESEQDEPGKSPSTVSQDSKDSGNVPLRAWKNGKRKGH